MPQVLERHSRPEKSAWGEKGARQLEKLVGAAQFHDFTLQGLDAFPVGGAHAVAFATVDLLALDLMQQRLRCTADHRRD